MKRVLFLATGGTIACRDSAEGLRPQTAAQALVESVPMLREVCEITAQQPYNLDSTNMSPREWTELARIIARRYSEFDGFVISHGTDTLAYAAAALSCLVRGRKPVVLTGSQMPMSAPKSDAPRNLRDAFICAASDVISGVCVVFGGRIIDGDCAVKVSTREYDAFRSVNRAELGSVDESGAIAANGDNCTQSEKASVFYDKMDTRIAVAKLIPGVPLRVSEGDCRAVIIEGFGTGGFPDYGADETRREVKRLIEKGIHVIMTTQVESGGTELARYEVGSAVNGVLEAQLMTREMCAMKAMWALAYSESVEQFRIKFYEDI